MVAIEGAFKKVSSFGDKAPDCFVGKAKNCSGDKAKANAEAQKKWEAFRQENGLKF